MSTKRSLRRAALGASLVVLCMAMGAALGGGLYEGIVLNPIWSVDPPRSFAIIQPDTGVPLQAFWIPLHAVITVAVLVAIGCGWRDVEVRRPLLVGLVAYVVMRSWSFGYFIPEMMEFQGIPVESAASTELCARVERWTRLTWLRMPLDLLATASVLLALRRTRGRGEG